MDVEWSAPEQQHKPDIKKTDADCLKWPEKQSTKKVLDTGHLSSTS